MIIIYAIRKRYKWYNKVLREWRMAILLPQCVNVWLCECVTVWVPTHGQRASSVRWRDRGSAGQTVVRRFSGFSPKKSLSATTNSYNILLFISQIIIITLDWWRWLAVCLTHAQHIMNLDMFFVQRTDLYCYAIIILKTDMNLSSSLLEIV